MDISDQLNVTREEVEPFLELATQPYCNRWCSSPAPAISLLFLRSYGYRA